MEQQTATDFSAFFAASEISEEIFDTTADAAHSSFRALESFASELDEKAANEPLKRGLGLLILNRFRDALDALEKADGKAAAYYRAQAAAALDRLDAARESLKQAAGSGWDKLVCDMEIAAIDVRDGQLKDAEKLVSKHESHGADRGEWHFVQGLIAEEQLNRPQAIAHYDRALELSPENPRILFRAAWLHDIVGDDNEAIDLYQQLARRPRTATNALINLAVIYEDIGHYDDAVDCLRRVLKTNPNHTRARLFLKDAESSREMVIQEGTPERLDPRQRLLDSPIAEYELSVRARNCLKKMNIRSLGDLIKLTEPELMAYKNFGETSLSEIKSLLAKKGLRLGQSPEEIDLNALPTEPERPAPAAVAAPAVPPGKEPMLQKSVSELELSVRSRRCLQRLNITTVGELIQMTEAELLATRNFGQTSLNEIKEKIATLGLSLARKG